jgi:uncharacterized membrane protein YhaH (DUF805 family)
MWVLGLGLVLTVTTQLIANEFGEMVALYLVGPCLGLIAALILFFLAQDRLTDFGGSKHWAWLVFVPAINIVAIVVIGCLSSGKAQFSPTGS